MRLPRRRFEQGCRVGAFALLGWLIGTSVFPSTSHRVEVARASDVAGRLASWTRSAASIPLHGEFSVTPEPWIVDWMRALARSGHAVSWSGKPPAVAISVRAMPDPGGGTQIDVAAPPGTRVAVRDEAGLIDSVRVVRLGARLVSPAVVGGVTASAGDQHFGAAPPDSATVKSVVVIGQASWEGKFIVSALEERGWPVIARFSVAPGVEVTQGMSGGLVLDTSTVAAVVATDTTIARYSDAVSRFVREGGGLVLAGPSSAARSMALLAPGTLEARYRPTMEPSDTIALGATGFYPVTALKSDGIAIEQRPAGIAMAARRVGAGRVMQVGYDDSWRWRMAGGSGSAAAHREWWSGVVASVAFAGGTPGAQLGSGNEASAPLAWMVDRLGAARIGPPTGGSHGPFDRRIFIMLIMILLLSEWASRRLRGLR